MVGAAFAEESPRPSSPEESAVPMMILHTEAAGTYCLACGSGIHRERVMLTRECLLFVFAEGDMDLALQSPSAAMCERMMQPTLAQRYAPLHSPRERRRDGWRETAACAILRTKGVTVADWGGGR